MPTPGPEQLRPRMPTNGVRIKIDGTKLHPGKPMPEHDRRFPAQGEKTLHRLRHTHQNPDTLRILDHHLLQQRCRPLPLQPWIMEID